MRKPKSQRSYTDTEKRYILKSGGVLTLAAIARNLGRTEGSVSNKACQMGVSLVMKGEEDGN